MASFTLIASLLLISILATSTLGQYESTSGPMPNNNFMAGLRMPECTAEQLAELPQGGNGGIGGIPANIQCRPPLSYFLQQARNALNNAVNGQ
jgi:hypothetical protein